MNRDEVKKMRVELDKVLGELAAKHGMTVKIGSISFSDSGMRPRVEFTKKDAATGEARDANWDRQCYRYGLDKEDLGKHIQYRGEEYKLVGMTSRYSSCPIVIQHVKTGTKYRIPAAHVREELGKGYGSDLTIGSGDVATLSVAELLAGKKGY